MFMLEPGRPVADRVYPAPQTSGRPTANMPLNYEAAYHEESDADDEYERSVIASPTLPTADYDSSSPTESDPLSNQPTPTTYTHSSTTGVSPRQVITNWAPETVADFVKTLGLEQYRNKIICELRRSRSLEPR